MIGQTQLGEPRNQKIRTAIGLLMEAKDYAEDTGCDCWDFAVSIEQLCRFNINESDLRWLVKKRFIDHSREVTIDGDNDRQFRPTRNLMFSHQSYFVLTELGIATAGSQLSSNSVDRRSFVTEADNLKPRWTADLRELTIKGTLVKRFKWQAMNQETILSAFEEDNWRQVIDDPLRPRPEQDSKRPLHDTIKALNRNQGQIRFHGNGTGEGVRWKLADAIVG